MHHHGTGDSRAVLRGGSPRGRSAEDRTLGNNTIQEGAEDAKPTKRQGRSGTVKFKRQRDKGSSRTKELSRVLKKKDEDRVFMGFDNRQIFHFCQSSFTGAVGVEARL